MPQNRDTAISPDVVDLIGGRRAGLEPATYFFLFGARDCGDGVVITLNDVLTPEARDLDDDFDLVRIREQYSVRAALRSRKSPLFIGVAHSHPQDYSVKPSLTDDDMDSYYAEYFSGFKEKAAYASLIFAYNSEKTLSFSGRGHIGGKDFVVNSLVRVEEQRIVRNQIRPKLIADPEDRARLIELYGLEAAERLANSTVAIIGVSGTGSPAAHVLARAGVGRFVLVDHDRLAKSNRERHGSYASHFALAQPPYKVEIVRDLIHAINPNAGVVPIAGSILDSTAIDAVASADLALCCTDTHHSRATVGELAYRYLLPSIDVGVQLEGDKQVVNAEVAQIRIFRPGGPCPYCMNIVDSWRLKVELMTEAEKELRKKAAAEALARGDKEGGYWKDIPALPTVGHFTTLAGALVATYAVGWLTGKFKAPHDFMEINVLEPGFGYVGFNPPASQTCSCQKYVGFSDQGRAFTNLPGLPDHWPRAKIL